MQCCKTHAEYGKKYRYTQSEMYRTAFMAGFRDRENLGPRIRDNWPKGPHFCKAYEFGVNAYEFGERDVSAAYLKHKDTLEQQRKARKVTREYRPEVFTKRY